MKNKIPVEKLARVQDIVSEDNFARTVSDVIRRKVNTITDLPFVSVDVGLGKVYGKGYGVEFDTNALSQTLDSARVRKEDRSQLDIILVKNMPQYKTAKGLYFPDEKDIFVRADRKAQKILQHEVKHFADDLSSEKNHNQGSGLYEAGVRYTNPVTLAGIAINGTNLINRAAEIVPISEQIPRAVSIGGVAMAATGLVLGMGYYLHPGERSARKAEKVDLPQVFQIKKYKGKHRK